jgi:ankyrin repeat protein
MGAPAADSLSWAAWGGHLETVRYLAGLTSVLDENFVTALMYASGKGHLGVVQYLVSLGTSIRAYDDSALFRARRNGHKEVADYLISLGARPTWTLSELVGWIFKQIGALRKHLRKYM